MNANGYNRRRRAWPPIVAERKWREALSRETPETRPRVP
jgi:hypothetical protein